MANLIKMKHVDTGHNVDVHPDMVDDYKSGGYHVIEQPKKPAKAKKAAD